MNKEEMTHPHRHIIIHSTTTNSAAALSSEPTTTATITTRQWKCSFIDFEKCALTRKPKNVTQLCQVRPKESFGSCKARWM